MSNITFSSKSEYAGITLELSTVARGRARYALPVGQGLTLVRDLPQSYVKGDPVRIIKVEDDCLLGCRIVTLDSGRGTPKVNLPSVELAKYLRIETL